jgi:hypothetical protein
VTYLAFVIACTTSFACGEQYCQRGPKDGGQCYTINEVEWQETQVRAEPPPECSTEPSPGCELFNLEKPYAVPLPGAGGGEVAPVWWTTLEEVILGTDRTKTHRAKHTAACRTKRPPLT